MTTYKLKDGLSVKKLGEEYFVLNRRSSKIFSFNETGNFVWGLLESERTEKELADAVAGEFEVPREDAESDVHGFVRELSDYDLLVESGRA